MSILFFASGNRGTEYRVRRVLRELGQHIECYRSLGQFAKRFQQPRNPIHMMILLIQSDFILDELIEMRDRMYELPTALILPDARHETLLKGHKFYPRFITFQGSDFLDLAIAVQNILQRESGSMEIHRGGGSDGLTLMQTG